MFVQALVPEATVERFDVGFLFRLAGLDQPQRDGFSMRPVTWRRPSSQPSGELARRSAPRKRLGV